MDESDLKQVPLGALHAELGARMVPFAGYAMPVQYGLGVMGEHNWTRQSAGLFDVSHMGQVILRGTDVAAALEALVPQDVIALAEGRQRYGFFTNDAGGIEDDLMIANRGDHLLLVVNAARKAEDIALMRAGLPGVEVAQIDRALLALQGPEAEAALIPVVAAAQTMAFMDQGIFESDYGPLWISRSGYSGEDGFEISVETERAEALARALLADPRVEPIGLGARDSLRLEAGLCLYGSDIDATTSPVEAGLVWAMQKARRPGGARAGGYPGAARIADELTNGAARRRVGLRPEGRAPMRAGVEIFADEAAGAAIGVVTSGAFGPSVGGPVAMGYVAAEHSEPGTRLSGELRGRRLPVQVEAMPFRAAGYKR